jgi:hypothetical protein
MIYIEWVQWENPVALWWVFLSAASLVNIIAWFWTWKYKFSNVNLNTVFSFRNNPASIIWLSGIYVFVCAFRSVLPRADVQRIVLFDTWFSSVFLGRTMATIAELAFVAQWFIVLKFLAKMTDNRFVQTCSQVILPLIVIAEICSWTAVITTNYLGNVIEESLWAITYLIIGASLVSLLKNLTGPLKRAAHIAIFGCFLYVSFMTFVDVPMYWQRHLQDVANNKPYLTFFEGLTDLNTRWQITYDIGDWKTEIPWKTLYFTFAVLVSIGLCYFPFQEDNVRKYLCKS